MNQLIQESVYEFQAKDLTQTAAIKQYTDHIVKEVKSQLGSDTSIQIRIEPETIEKHVFSVSMTVLAPDAPIVITKEGKNVLTLLRKIRRGVLRQVRRLREKRNGYRRKHFLREQFAS